LVQYDAVEVVTTIHVHCMCLCRAVASLKEAEGHQLWVEGHGSEWGRDLPLPRGVRGSRPSEKYIYNAKSCILVHPWFRKWAAADRHGFRRHG